MITNPVFPADAVHILLLSSFPIFAFRFIPVNLSLHRQIQTFYSILTTIIGKDFGCKIRDQDSNLTFVYHIKSNEVFLFKLSPARFKVHHSVKLAFEFSHIRSSPRRLGSPARSVDCCCCFAGISICAPKGSRFGHFCYFQSSILLYSDVNTSRKNSTMMLQRRTLD